MTTSDAVPVGLGEDVIEAAAKALAEWHPRRLLAHHHGGAMKTRNEWACLEPTRRMSA